MRFSKAALVGTLAAAALSLLIALPAAAEEGRAPYLVSLQPEWNLISIPANPVDPAIGSVLPLTHPARTVFSYQNGHGAVAIHDSKMDVWVGSLTEIVAGYGYYISTTDSTPLETVLSETDSDDDLPEIPVVSGWNLLGVMDADQAPQGATVDADDYFSEIEWSVAYGFDTAADRWHKITHDSGVLKNGSGYWVWVSRYGCLCL